MALISKKLRISQQELANKTGIGLRTITSYEANSSKPRFDRNYVALAKTLNVSVEFLKIDDREENKVEVLKNQFNALFAGGKLSENDMEEIMFGEKQQNMILTHKLGHYILHHDSLLH